MADLFGQDGFGEKSNARLRKAGPRQSRFSGSTPKVEDIRRSTPRESIATRMAKIVSRKSDPLAKTEMNQSWRRECLGRARLAESQSPQVRTKSWSRCNQTRRHDQ